jgi:hypothetical protein
MNRNVFLLPLIAILFTLVFSCDTEDDGVIIVPPRERDEEVIPATLMIENYLETHFYNYEQFANPPADFNYQIIFDTIAGDNSNKTPLIDQVSFKNVDDIFQDGVVYKLYYLKVRQGEGDAINFSDKTTLNYVGTSLREKEILVNDVYETVYPTETFDSSVSPISFDLTRVVKGFQATLIEFNGATGFTENPDGTLTFDDFGIGAVFMQSGLGYYNTPPVGSGIEFYDQLIFTFQTYAVEKTDQDLDTILSEFEDLNGNGNELDDDTDNDGFPNFNDPDDDGDGKLTRFEVEANQYTLNPGDADPELAENEVEMQRKTNLETGIVTLYTVVFTDANNDGIADYLDENTD